MKRSWLLTALLLEISLSLRALQGNTPQAALEEIATADKPEILARHLPDPVQKRIERLPKLKKQEVLDKLLSMKIDQLGGCKLRPAGNGDGWEIMADDGKSKGRVRLANAFISGVDAMLPLQIDSPDGSVTFIVTMHLEGDDWRIDDFGPWEKTDLGLNKLLHEPTEAEKNEAAAQETLRTLINALYYYARWFPQRGFPRSLRDLTQFNNQAPLAVRSAWLDESFAADPLIKHGYEFHYLLTRAGNGQEEDPGIFAITASPVEFGTTGSKNFFADQGSIHMTKENRPANEDDPGPDE